MGAQLIVCVDEDKHRLSATEDINNLVLRSLIIFCRPKTLRCINLNKKKKIQNRLLLPELNNKYWWIRASTLTSLSAVKIDTLSLSINGSQRSVTKNYTCATFSGGAACSFLHNVRMVHTSYNITINLVPITPQFTPQTILNPVFAPLMLEHQIVSCFFTLSPTHSCFEWRLHERTVIAVCLRGRAARWLATNNNGSVGVFVETGCQVTQDTLCTYSSEKGRIADRGWWTVLQGLWVFAPHEELYWESETLNGCCTSSILQSPHLSLTFWLFLSAGRTEREKTIFKGQA